MSMSVRRSYHGNANRDREYELRAGVSIGELRLADDECASLLELADEVIDLW